MRALVSFTVQRNMRVNIRITRLWSIRHSQPVQDDRLVSYPLVLYLSFLSLFICEHPKSMSLFGTVVSPSRFFYLRTAEALFLSK